MESQFSLKAAMLELEAIEKFFQNPEMALEEALTQYQKAKELGAQIAEYLQSVETTLEKIEQTIYEK